MHKCWQNIAPEILQRIVALLAEKSKRDDDRQQNMVSTNR